MASDAESTRSGAGPLSILERLPKDVLTTIICDYACASTEDSFNPDCRAAYNITERGERRQSTQVVLSHTCRALRSFVFNLPTLWSVLDSKMHLDEVDEYVSRSGETGLSITLHEPSSSDEDEQDFWAFFIFVSEFAHRWTHLHFQPWDELWDIPREFYKLLNWQLKSIDVMRLECLSMMFYYADGYEEDEDYNKEGRFYNHWNMPVLRRLRTTEIAPVAAFGSTLTTFHVILPENFDDSPHLLKHILEMLASTPILEEFHLEALTTLSTLGCDQTVQTISLPRLQHLSFSYAEQSRDDSTPDIPRIFMETLEAPSLTTYGCGMSSIRVWERRFQFSSEDVNPEYFMSFFSNAKNMANVQELQIYKGIYDLPQPPVASILRKLPRLHTLKFKDAMLTVELDKLDGTLPPLCDIHFDHCELSAAFLRSCVDMLRNSPRWSTFNAFHFKFCTDVSEKEVLAIIPKEKADWEGLLEI